MDPELEQSVRQLLNGVEEERAEGLKLIDESLRHSVCDHIAKRFPGMSVEDRADCWCETLRNIWQNSQKRMILLESNIPLWNLVWKISYSRAADNCKRRRKYVDIVHEIGTNLRSTSVGNTWGSFDPAERKELTEIIRDRISELPPRQKIVLQAFADNFPIRIKDLAMEVSRLTGTNVTEKAVERALAQGRSKLRDVIEKTAYSIEVNKQ